MTYPSQRVQVDVKVVPHRYIADPELHLYQYTAIDEFTRLRFLAVYPKQSTFSFAGFLKKLVKLYASVARCFASVERSGNIHITIEKGSNCKRPQALCHRGGGRLSISQFYLVGSAHIGCIDKPL